MHRIHAIVPPTARRALGAAAVSTLLGLSSLQAQAATKATAPQDPRWTAIRALFHQGEAEDGYLRINLPRSDLHVSINGTALVPDFEFRSYIGFVPTGRSDVLAMGEIVLLQSEVPAVIAEAFQQGIQVTAVHNHLMNETPRIMFLHVMAEGPAAKVANELHATFAKSATPLTPPKDEPSRASWSAIDAVLGPHAEASGVVAEYGFARREPLRVHGVSVKSSGLLETASEVVFQQISGNRVANTGELYLLASEVEPVTRALEEHGLHVTALHTHMLDDGPPHYWVHWYATGDGPTLARGIAAALTHMNGAQKSKAED